MVDQVHETVLHAVRENGGIIPHLSTGNFPHEEDFDLRDNARMAKPAENRFKPLIARIDERLEMHGLTDRQASLRAVGTPDMIRDLRRERSMPKRERLASLARVLGTSIDYLLDGRDVPALDFDRDTATRFEDGRVAWRAHEHPRDVPAYGTVLGGDYSVQPRERGIETHIIEQAEVVDYFRRPPALVGRNDLYGLFVHGSSMEPRFFQGARVIVDPRRPPAVGDDVIVQIRGGEDQAESVVTALIKTLVRRAPDHVELRQFNPQKTFIVPIKQIAAIHRVLSMDDLLGS